MSLYNRLEDWNIMDEGHAINRLWKEKKLKSVHYVVTATATRGAFPLV